MVGVGYVGAHGQLRDAVRLNLHRTGGSGHQPDAMQNHASGLPLPSAARWNCCVDEELRRELLTRRDEDQRIRNLVSPVQQRAFLHALRSAAAQGQASRAHLAYLEDRVRVNADQPQLYGTQFTVTDGELGPSPIEDRERLDERRAEAGLEPFADYKARMRDQS